MIGGMGFSQLFTGNADYYTMPSDKRIPVRIKIAASINSSSLPGRQPTFCLQPQGLRHLFRIKLYGIPVLCSFTV
jgi:hypothetical protein